MSLSIGLIGWISKYCTCMWKWFHVSISPLWSHTTSTPFLSQPHSHTCFLSLIDQERNTHPHKQCVFAWKIAEMWLGLRRIGTLIMTSLHRYATIWTSLNWPRKKGDRVKTMRRPDHLFWVGSGWSRWSWACFKGHGCTEMEHGRVERRMIEYKMVKMDVMECGQA